MPDDFDARVRALEQANAAANERDEMFDRMFRELYPLVELYGRLDERFNTLLRDLGGAHKAIRELEHVVDTELEAHREEQKHQQKLIDDARNERTQQIAQLENDQKTRFAQIVAGIITVFLTSLTGVVIAYLQQKGGLK